MAKSVTITLTSAGEDTGPFNLLSDANSFASPFELNISKLSLVGGYTSNLVPDAATIIRIQSSSSICTNFIDEPYPTLTTSTTTTTTTTSSPATVNVKFYSIGTSGSLASLTCNSTSSYDVQIFGDPGNDSPVFCGPDELLAVDITNILNDGHSIPVGSSFYLASGGQVRTWIRQFNDNLAYWHLDSCTAC